MRWLTALLALMALAAPAAAQSSDEPRLAAAVFRSAFCGQCRVIEARLDDVRPDYAGAAMEWVEFDFTFGARGALAERAAAERLSGLYGQLAPRTGFIVLVDRETGQAIEIITARYGRDQMRAAFDRALAITAS